MPVVRARRRRPCLASDTRVAHARAALGTFVPRCAGRVLHRRLRDARAHVATARRASSRRAHSTQPADRPDTMTRCRSDARRFSRTRMNVRPRPATAEAGGPHRRLRSALRYSIAPWRGLTTRRTVLSETRHACARPRLFACDLRPWSAGLPDEGTHLGLTRGPTRGTIRLPSRTTRRMPRPYPA